METKSRYEVIAELESKKRDLIRERDSLEEQMKAKEKELRDFQRARDDQLVAHERRIEDTKEGLELFKKNMAEKKETIKELIQSIDTSLERFGKIQNK